MLRSICLVACSCVVVPSARVGADVEIYDFVAAGIASGDVRLDGDLIDTFEQGENGYNDGTTAGVTSCGGLIDDWYYLAIEGAVLVDISETPTGSEMRIQAEALAAVLIDDPPGAVDANIGAAVNFDYFTIIVDEPTDFVLEFLTELPDSGFNLSFAEGESGTLFPGEVYMFDGSFGMSADVDDPLEYFYVEAVMTFTSPCPADLDGDGDVGVNDLLIILPIPYGPCPDCPEDINGDGEISVDDMLEILSSWGACP